MAAFPPGSRRYTSPVYEDKYFPERHAVIPFKWEMFPGRPNHDSGDDDEEDKEEEGVAAEYDGGHEELAGSCLRWNPASNRPTDHRDIISRDPAHLPDSPALHAPAAACSLTIVYPLPPPPRLAPASPLLVKDLLLDGGMHHLQPCNDRSAANDQSSPLQADRVPLQHDFRRHFFSRLSLIRFRPLKAASSTVVPLHKNSSASTTKPHLNVAGGEAQTSVLAVSAAPYQRVRSQSFRHAGNVHEAVVGAKHTGSNVAHPASLQASRRRCNSFNNTHSTSRAAVTNFDGSHDVVDNNDPSSISAAAMWTGACILAAAGVHDAVFSDEFQHGPCRVAMKLSDLMQQSRNFSMQLVERPCTMKKLKKGGQRMIDEGLLELGLCQQATVAPGAKIKRTKSAEEPEEEVQTEAFLGETMKKYDAEEHGGKIITAKEEEDDDDDPQTNKGDKGSSFCKVFINDCIACWCPSPYLA